MQLIKPSGIARIMSLLVIGSGLASTAANAATTQSASVFLVGKSFGNGVNLSVNSGNWQIAPSKLFTYNLNATITGVKPQNSKPGVLTMKDLVPQGTKINQWVDQIAPGSSALFNGTFENPSGKLPVVIVDRKISGTETLPVIGKVSISLNLKVEILASGQVVLGVTNVSAKTSAGKIPGTIKFGRGSTVTISTAPLVEFKSIALNVDENAGSVKVVIWRQGNRAGKATAKWTTVGGTAVADVDFKQSSGTVAFANNQIEKIISIPINDNLVKNPFKRFTIQVSDPSKGTVLGNKTTMTIGIKDND